MDREKQGWNSLSSSSGAWLPICGGVCVFLIAYFIDRLPASPDPLLFGQLQFTSGIVAITFAGTAFVRFRGTRDRLPLILAAGFVLVGVTLASSSLGLGGLSTTDSAASLRDPMTWVIGRTLLAILLVAALLVERRHAWSARPGRDITAALVLVALAATLLSAVHRFLPIHLVVHPNTLFPRPGNLVPAVLFLVASLGYQHHLRRANGVFERALYLAATINFWCSVAAAQSESRLDANFGLAAVLQFTSYSVLLGGALFDNVRLFRDVQRLAVTDPVTGLANYRQLINSLELEMQRTGRTERSFALLLFDLDGLKQINDQFGHQVGTRALCRAADVLRVHSRAIDTAARHGGDEFALVLPETALEGAQEVMSRICERTANDGENPPISLSAGFAIYPQHGNSAETLMAAADRALYIAKEAHKRNALLLSKAAV